MYTRYLENQVLGAEPVELVQMLYAGAIDAVRQAQQHMEEGRITERAAAISRAMQIIIELQGSLDMEQGGEIALGLAQLYIYIQERLIEANGEQKRAALDEALALMLILEEGWKEAGQQMQSLAPAPRIPVESAAGWTL